MSAFVAEPGVTHRIHVSNNLENELSAHTRYKVTANHETNHRDMEQFTAEFTSRANKRGAMGVNTLTFPERCSRQPLSVELSQRVS